MANNNGYPTQEDLQRAERITENKKYYAELEKEQIQNLQKMRNAGLELTKDMEKRVRLVDAEKGGLADMTPIYSKLNKQAKTLNTKKKKMANISLGVLDALKDEYSTTNMTSGALKSQTDIVEQIASGLATSTEIMQEFVNLGEDATEEMKSYLKVQYKTAKVTELVKGNLGDADGLIGGMGTKLKGFLLNPLTMAVALLATFSSQQEAIATQFGAIGVTEFRDELADASQEFIGIGLSAAQAQSTISSLSNEFGIGFIEAQGLAAEVGKLSVSTGLALDDTTKLVGLFTKTQGLTGKQASNLIKQTQQLAKANNVAPDKVLSDIAKSTEAFAKFSKDGGENILRAAIQARKLGISLDTVAKTAEGLLNFNDSLNKEIEASILLGRTVNLQKARELSLANDIEGLQKEIVKQVGSEAEFNAMNAFQRQALADALSMNVEQIQKLVSGEKEAVTLAGALAKQSTENMIPEKTITSTAKLIANLQKMGMELAETVAPAIEKMVGVMSGLASMIEKSIGFFPLFLLYLGSTAIKAGLAAKASISQTLAILGVTKAKKADNVQTLLLTTNTAGETVATIANTTADLSNTVAKTTNVGVTGTKTAAVGFGATISTASTVATGANTVAENINTNSKRRGITTTLASAKANMVAATTNFFGGAAKGSTATLGFGTPVMVAMAVAAIATMFGAYTMSKGLEVGTKLGGVKSDTVQALHAGETILNKSDTQMLEKQQAAMNTNTGTPFKSTDTAKLENQQQESNKKLDRMVAVLESALGGPNPALARSMGSIVGSTVTDMA
mgnify:FL=1